MDHLLEWALSAPVSCEVKYPSAIYSLFQTFEDGLVVAGFLRGQDDVVERCLCEKLEQRFMQSMRMKVMRSLIEAMKNQEANVNVHDTADKASQQRRHGAYDIAESGRYTHLDDRRCCRLKLSNHAGSAHSRSLDPDLRGIHRWRISLLVLCSRSFRGKVGEPTLKAFSLINTIRPIRG